MLTSQVRKILTSDKDDKLTYERDSEVFTFKTKTGEPPGLIAGYVRDVLRQFDPRILEFYEYLRTGKVIVRFYLLAR